LSVTRPFDLSLALYHKWSIVTMRLSGTVTEIWRLKGNGVTSLTFWIGHVTVRLPGVEFQFCMRLFSNSFMVCWKYATKAFSHCPRNDNLPNKRYATQYSPSFLFETSACVLYHYVRNTLLVLNEALVAALCYFFCCTLHLITVFVHVLLGVNGQLICNYWVKSVRWLDLKWRHYAASKCIAFAFVPTANSCIHLVLWINS